AAAPALGAFDRAADARGQNTIGAERLERARGPVSPRPAVGAGRGLRPDWPNGLDPPLAIVTSVDRPEWPVCHLARAGICWALITLSTFTMGMEPLAPPLPPIPDLSTVAEVIRLADAAEAERFEQRPSSYSTYRFDDLDSSLRPRPARDALVAYLRGLPETI